jgi:hypothetical protein
MDVSFRAYLAVESGTHTLADLHDLLGRENTGGYERGSVARFSRRVRPETSWTFDLRMDSGVHAGTEGLSAAIEALGDELAQQLRSLSDEGCSVLLVVVQELSQAPRNKGLELSPIALTWLATAGAKLIVDQYVICSGHSESS